MEDCGDFKYDTLPKGGVLLWIHLQLHHFPYVATTPTLPFWRTSGYGNVQGVCLQPCSRISTAHSIL